MKSADLTDDLCRIAQCLGIEAEPPNCDTSAWTFEYKGPVIANDRERASIVNYILELADVLRKKRLP